MIPTVRSTLRELTGTVQRLDGLLADDDAEDLPGIDQAKLLLLADRANGQLAKVADRLAACAARGRGPARQPK